MKRLKFACALVICAGLCSTSAMAKDKKKSESSAKDYVAKLQAAFTQPQGPSSSGSLWRDSGGLASIASDYKARSVGDLVVISIVEQTLAQASGTVATQRTFSANSGVTGLVGRINTGGANPLVGANSDTQLKGQAQTASTTSLRTSVAGQVIAALPNGDLVIEAHREVLMNNEHQTVFLRGVARPGDLSVNNVVLSTQLSSLEVELRGKGVISENTRQPNWIVRALMRLLTF